MSVSPNPGDLIQTVTDNHPGRWNELGNPSISGDGYAEFHKYECFRVQSILGPNGQGQIYLTVKGRDGLIPTTAVRLISPGDPLPDKIYFPDCPTTLNALETKTIISRKIQNLRLNYYTASCYANRNDSGYLQFNLTRKPNYVSKWYNVIVGHLGSSGAHLISSTVNPGLCSWLKTDSNQILSKNTSMEKNLRLKLAESKEVISLYREECNNHRKQLSAKDKETSALKSEMVYWQALAEERLKALNDKKAELKTLRGELARIKEDPLGFARIDASADYDLSNIICSSEARRASYQEELDRIHNRSLKKKLKILEPIRDLSIITMVVLVAIFLIRIMFNF